MTIIKISDIVKDIDDIENYIEAVKKKKIALFNSVNYHPLDMCDDVIIRYLKTKDKQSKNLEYLMKGNLPIRHKFFSARNENILYLLEEYKAFCTVNFTIANDGIIRFVNDTNECISLLSHGGLVMEHEGKEQPDRFNTYIITLLEELKPLAFVDEMKIKVKEFVIAEEIPYNKRVI